jgi:4-hydroxybenzoate polyprenyltransferase
VYAQQDVEDDTKAGVKSMAVRFKDGPRSLLAFVASSEVLLLLASGYMQGFGSAYFSVACGGSAALLFWNVYTVDLKNPGECMW